MTQKLRLGNIMILRLLALSLNNAVHLQRSGSTYIYIAIRRGPMRAPESGTEVFAVAVPYAGSITVKLPVDLQV
jgi:hypothetical protein